MATKVFYGGHAGKAIYGVIFFSRLIRNAFVHSLCSLEINKNTPKKYDTKSTIKSHEYSNSNMMEVDNGVHRIKKVMKFPLLSESVGREKYTRLQV